MPGLRPWCDGRRSQRPCARGQSPRDRRPEAMFVPGRERHERRTLRFSFCAHLVRMHAPAAGSAEAMGLSLCLWRAPKHPLHRGPARDSQKLHIEFSKVGLPPSLSPSPLCPRPTTALTKNHHPAPPRSYAPFRPSTPRWSRRSRSRSLRRSPTTSTPRSYPTQNDFSFLYHPSFFPLPFLFASLPFPSPLRTYTKRNYACMVWRF